ncbi:MAG: ABC transporter permease [Dehalococcoidales bacterium]|nr:ABC transporter permease [Dehalococcoidales bacterium]
MTTNETDSGEFLEAPSRSSGFRRFFKVFLSRKIVLISFIVIVLLVIVAIFAPLIAPHDPYKQVLSARLEGPSSTYLLGTDYLGRDLLSRMIYGSRTALLVGIIATGIAATFGTILGTLAGYFGGWVHAVIMRFVDALMSIPMIVVALILSVLLGSGLGNIMIAVGISMSASYARVICGLVMSIRQNDYILASAAGGASNMRIMLRHCLPNSFPPFMVLITINMGGAIMIEAALSYLGLGIEPPGAAWGAMVQEGYGYLIIHPTLALVPGVAIAVVVYALNMIGDGLRDALDPRLRGYV